MCLEPFKIKSVEPIPFTTRSDRSRALEEADWNVFRLPASKVTVDLLTDSGTCAMSTDQWSALWRGDETYAQSRSFERLESCVRELTGLPHVLPTHQGRAAERILFDEMLSMAPGNDVCEQLSNLQTTGLCI